MVDICTIPDVIFCTIKWSTVETCTSAKISLYTRGHMFSELSAMNPIYFYVGYGTKIKSVPPPITRPRRGATLL